MMIKRLILALLPLTASSVSAAAQGIVTLVAGNATNLQVAPSGILAVPLVLDMSQAGGGAVQNLAGTIGWNSAALRLDSLTTGFGSQTLNLYPSPAGGAQYTLSGASPVTATTTVGTLWFTATGTQGGSRIQLTVSSASNPVGSLALGRVLTRNAEVCVAPIGVWGDANGDAAVDIIDAQQLARFTIGLSVANVAAVNRAGDVNGDQSVNIVDAQQIARFAVSLPAVARISGNLFTPPAVSSVVLNRASFNLTNGLQVLLAATPLDASGQAIIGCQAIAWSSSNAGTATVNAAGLVHGLSGGATTVTVTVGALTAQTAITVVTPDTTVAFQSLRNITASGNNTSLDGAWMLGGLLADEWRSSDTFTGRNFIDQRTVADNEGQVTSTLRAMYKARADAMGALPALRAASAPGVHIARMYFIIGYVELMLAENFCNGVYLNDASSGLVLNGPPITNAALYSKAIVHFDSALAVLSATDAFTTSVSYLVRLGKARALVQTGQFSTAAAIVAPIPTSYQDSTLFTTATESNKMWLLSTSQRRYSVADTTGGSFAAIVFAAPARGGGPPQDVRLPVFNNSLGFDGSTQNVRQDTWLQTTVAPIFTGIDARLIEAEVKFQSGDFPGTTAILNQLRTQSQKVGALTTTAMAPLGTPTSGAAANRAQLFQERAYWTFGRGQRLGDLRRLMRIYLQTESATFTTGLFHKSGNPPFGTIKNLPANVDEEGNAVTTVCIDRNP